MNTPGPSGKTDFTGIVNAVQMLTQIVGQGGKAFTPVIASDSGAPTPSPANALDMIRINAGGTAYEVRTPSQVASDLGQLPPTVGIALDMVRVNSLGTVYEARTPSQVVADLGLLNASPVGTGIATTGTTVSVTTTSFTAPCSGALVIIGRGVVESSPNALSTSLTTSLAGLVVILAATSFRPRAFGYLPMNAAQSTTATFGFSVIASQPIQATVAAFFLPQA